VLHGLDLPDDLVALRLDELRQTELGRLQQTGGEGG
jgi:hypothetical protein